VVGSSIAPDPHAMCNPDGRPRDAAAQKFGGKSLSHPMDRLAPLTQDLWLALRNDRRPPRAIEAAA